MSLEDTTTTSSSATVYSWMPTTSSPDLVDCLCLGTGRFLRAVLTPALVGAGFRSALIQTRGRTFLDYMRTTGSSSSSFEVDTVLSSGEIQTEQIPCHGAFTMGTPEGQQVVLEFMNQMKRICIIGVGVTEAGLASSSAKGITDLYKLLQACRQHLVVDQTWTCCNPHGRICIINTDNVPNNGNVIKSHMLELANTLENNEDMKEFLETRVAFLNTMVDRITSQREGSGAMVPRCEPVPAKALVILDEHGDLPPALSEKSTMRDTYGVVVRTTSKQLQGDIALKLRVANGTHTAIAHTMALCRLLQTDVLSTGKKGELLMSYLDALFTSQILPGASYEFGKEETIAAYQDWRGRLCHAHFGLSSFFITQNGAAKGGIRLGPTAKSLLLSSSSQTEDQQPITVAMAFAFAALLRWLTPAKPVVSTPKNGVYRGWLDGSSRVASSTTTTKSDDDDGDVVEYADGLSHNLHEGWYEFRCACSVSVGKGGPSRPVCEWLGDFETSQQPRAYVSAVRAYLTTSNGGNLGDVASNSKTKEAFDALVQAIATLYARMVAGDGMMELLKEMEDSKGVYVNGFNTDCRVLVDGESLENGRPLHYRASPIPSDSQLLYALLGTDRDTISSVIVSEVASALAIDLHTHLLPPSHGSLCLWGIDELVTYHYLVAEYFITAPASVTPEAFYALSKREQADIIWKALFVDRSPVSEACRGVVTTLQAMGLSSAVAARDLDSVRKYYTTFRDDGLEGIERFSEMVYTMAGVRYAIMTNIPFDSNEAQHWRPKRKEYPARYRSALRVDPLLAGDTKTVETALRVSGYDDTLEGARQYLRDWCDTMKPEYMMASTPHDFVLQEGGPLTGVTKTGVNEEAMKQPFAFVDVTGSRSGADCAVTCDGEEDATASIINEKSDLLSEVLMKVCEERDLPVALKIGAHRGVNPKLKSAGDGVVAFADTGVLARLCTRFPKVRFLATFLSRNNQHEACVLASKFRNLHLYGCWWFCNNPSLIAEITKMRVEMLGTAAFTAQHSDARVLDQLIYKWSHSRAVIAKVLVEEYAKLNESGWSATRGEIRRDVERLFGGSYEEFMAKSFA